MSATTASRAIFPLLTIEGATEAGAAATADYEQYPEFDTVDKLLVAWVIAESNEFNKTRDPMFSRLRQHFSEAQIVERIWEIAFCGAFDHFNDILQLDMEAAAPAKNA